MKIWQIFMKKTTFLSIFSCGVAGRNFFHEKNILEFASPANMVYSTVMKKGLKKPEVNYTKQENKT